ncbi:Metalloenzyme, LuxS/M16 peptidase-like protein [Mycena galericulata]|nr:Metalloenzyme, LuxS/M16 peptidase-like protein [Mycena galericulata]
MALPNKIRVYSWSLFLFGLLIDAGSRYETPATSGASHFLNRMAVKTTTSRLNDEMAAAVHALGGQILRPIPPCDLQALSLIADAVFNPAFLREEIEAQRDAAHYDVREICSKPERILPKILHHVAYGGRGLGNPLLCPEERIDLINGHILQPCMKEWYRPGADGHRRRQYAACRARGIGPRCAIPSHNPSFRPTILLHVSPERREVHIARSLLPLPHITHRVRLPRPRRHPAPLVSYIATPPSHTSALLVIYLLSIPIPSPIHSPTREPAERAVHFVPAPGIFKRLVHTNLVQWTSCERYDLYRNQPEVTIGRAPASTIRIPHLKSEWLGLLISVANTDHSAPTVSVKHATLRWKGVVNGVGHDSQLPMAALHPPTASSSQQSDPSPERLPPPPALSIPSAGYPPPGSTPISSQVPTPPPGP